MPARCDFLGWNRPALLAAHDYLRERFCTGRVWDLQPVVIVVPGRRAGRRLLELLASTAQQEKLDFSPPTITTEGRLPELLYQPKFPFADTLTQELAWAAALQKIAHSELAAITGHPPASDDARGWLALGRVMRAQHVELAADTMNFADVVAHGSNIASFPDLARWQAMSDAQHIYWQTLDALHLWDVQTARLEAIKRREIHTPCELILLGTVDLNRTLRKFLDQVPDRATALIAAPPELRDWFDEHGCLLPARWCAAPLPLKAEQVFRVDGAADQADLVAKMLASYGGRYRSDQITIGMTDEQLVRQVQRQLQQCHVPVRWVEGKLLPETAPIRLLAAVAEFLGEESAAAFASLLRHPDVFAWLQTGEAHERILSHVLSELDDLQGEHLVTRMDPQLWPRKALTSSAPTEPPTATEELVPPKIPFAQLRQALTRVSTWLSPLLGNKRRLAEWAPRVLPVLKTIYHQAKLSRETTAALERLRDLAQEFAHLPTELDVPLSGEEAVQWMLERLATEAIPPPADEEAVELLGWLELPLDDAPALIVTTFNEGLVPESVSADAFLPNSLRKQLGLLDNERRYARDAYNVALLCHSRENVQFITARRDTEGNPLMPSRLLFAAPQEEVVSRAAQFFQPLPATPPRIPLVGFDIPLPAKSAFVVPSPRELSTPWETIGVTQFRDYLACPYRFYLKHVLNLASAGEVPEELAGNQFGNLAHDVLQAFGRDPQIRDSARAEEIFAYLEDQLQRRVQLHYGEHERLAAVELQMEQLRARLLKFSQWQAARVQAGWRIVFTENTEEDSRGKEPTALFSLGNIEIQLKGRIDRIDRHEARNELAIFDYKTADAGEKPEKTHRKRDTWIDLQLPLYRHLAKAWGHEADVVRLGYILLPRSLELVGEAMADWSDEELLSADETASAVIRSIRAQEFWPPADPPAYPDDFTALCQDRRLGGRNLEE